VRSFPEELAELGPSMPGARRDEVGEQRARLLRRREWHRSAVAEHLERAEQPDAECHVGIRYCSRTVTLRFGTKPTRIRAVSFIDATSTTETSLVTGFAT